jgi:molecular chaperone GrpE
MTIEKEAEGIPEDSGNPATTSLPSAPPVSAEAYDKLLAEKQEVYDRLLRKQAELDNFRKRSQKEKEEFRQHATEDLIRSLLPTLDGFERALNHREPGVPESYYQGLELIFRELREVLGRVGLTPIEATGTIFDPHLHQAVETVDAPDRREHEVVEELQRGYKLRSRLLRPAIVRIATGAHSQDSSQGGERDRTTI